MTVLHLISSTFEIEDDAIIYNKTGRTARLFHGKESLNLGLCRMGNSQVADDILQKLKAINWMKYRQ
jgi:hypothetical protein